jgi:hypothetical protein
MNITMLIFFAALGFVDSTMNISASPQPSGGATCRRLKLRVALQLTVLGIFVAFTPAQNHSC